MDIAPPPDVAGRALPGGHYRITEEENRRFCASVGAGPDPSGRAHPLFYYVATQCAMGISVADLLRLCDFDVEDGPLMTGSQARFHRDLRVARDYTVAGTIVSLVRKPSRTFGLVDMLTFRLTLAEAEMAVAEAVSSWMLPRGKAR